MLGINIGEIIGKYAYPYNSSLEALEEPDKK